MNYIEDYSPNHSKKSRFKKNIKFVIIHYTGMQSEIESINRLKKILNLKLVVTTLSIEEEILFNWSKIDI